MWGSGVVQARQHRTCAPHTCTGWLPAWHTRVQMMSAMAAARGVDGAAVREAVEAAPLLPAAALRRGLLDGTKYK